MKLNNSAIVYDDGTGTGVYGLLQDIMMCHAANP